jgi:hypothetical protein
MNRMRESVRRERKIPKFRPLPTNLRQRRTLIESYGRFYYNYFTNQGRIKRGSFQAKFPQNTSGRNKNRLMRFIVGKLLYEKMVPVLRQGQIVTVGELLQRTSWIRVRRVRNYKAGVVYEP